MHMSATPATTAPVIGTVGAAAPAAGDPAAPTYPVAPSAPAFAPAASAAPTVIGTVGPATPAATPAAPAFAPAAPPATPVAPAFAPAAPAAQPATPVAAPASPAVEPVYPAAPAAPVAPAAAAPVYPNAQAAAPAPVMPVAPPNAGFAPAEGFVPPVEPYAPPTSKIPDAPEVPGKWQPQYSRDRKSYVVPGLDGVRQTDTLTRATSHAKVLGDSSNLADWRVRATVLGLARNPELLDSLNVDGASHISELDFMAKRALNSIAWQASRRVGADDGSDFGTKLHGYLQAVLEGATTIDAVPDMLRPYLLVMFEAMRQHKLSFVGGMCERTVFIPATGMVGTFDFMVMDENGTLCIGDLKTSNSIDFSWLSIAVQLAQYASSTLILSWDGTRWERMPEVSQVMGKVLSVPKDVTVPHCRIYSVNLELGLEMVETANRVKAVTEAALRGASDPQRYTVDDEVLAWADGAAIPLTAVPAPGAVA